MHIILISPSGKDSFSVMLNIKFGNESKELATQMPIVACSAVTNDILGFSGYTIAMNLNETGRKREKRIKLDWTPSKSGSEPKGGLPTDGRPTLDPKKKEKK